MSETKPATPITKQFVNFAFYKVDAAWRRLPQEERDRGKQEFATVVQWYQENGMIVLGYSLVGLRGDCDLMLWRITERLESLQEMTAALLGTGLGKWLSTPYSYFAMTKRSMYIAAHEHIGGQPAASRERIVPGLAKYNFVYPFIKTHEWYQLPLDQRQAMMNEHFKVGHKYPSVKVNTTYSFGLDDQEFVLAFETDSPADFLDLVMELRESKARPFTERDTPIFSCVRGDIPQILNTLG